MFSDRDDVFAQESYVLWRVTWKHAESRLSTDIDSHIDPIGGGPQST